MNATARRTFDDMANDDRWLGFGYLGGRRNALDDTDPGAPAQPELVAATDRRIADETADWTDEELFAWANSKDGRWFADGMFGGAGRFDERFLAAARYLRKQR